MLIPTLFLFKTGWAWARKRKKNLFLNSVHTRPVQGNSEKKKKVKKFKKLKKPFPALFFAKTG